MTCRRAYTCFAICSPKYLNQCHGPILLYNEAIFRQKCTVFWEDSNTIVGAETLEKQNSRGLSILDFDFLVLIVDGCFLLLCVLFLYAEIRSAALQHCVYALIIVDSNIFYSNQQRLWFTHRSYSQQVRAHPRHVSKIVLAAVLAEVMQQSSRTAGTVS